MKREKDGWHIIDIVVDGVSTVENYRSSFARIISKEGVEGLIKRLERGGSPVKS
jgi:phospholipid transport system substrate-binding protein